MAEPEVTRETTTPSQRKRAATITGLTVTVLYTALSLFCWQHLVSAGVTAHMYRADVGDVGQRVWFMAWLPFAIAHHTNPFVSTYMFAPHGINVLANASVLFEAFLFSPITELSSPITSVNIACIAAPVVSALSLYFVLRRYEMRRSVAFVGGLIYGFSPALLQSNGLADFNLTWMFFRLLVAHLIDLIFFRQTGRPVDSVSCWVCSLSSSSSPVKRYFLIVSSSPSPCSPSQSLPIPDSSPHTSGSPR